MLILGKLKIVGYPLPVFTNRVKLFFNFRIKISKLKLRLDKILIDLFLNDNCGFLKTIKIKGPLIQGF
jgi:hypothetical protein